MGTYLNLLLRDPPRLTNPFETEGVLARLWQGRAPKVGFRCKRGVLLCGPSAAAAGLFSPEPSLRASVLWVSVTLGDVHQASGVRK